VCQALCSQVIDDVSCSWHSVCLVSRGSCYVCDVTAARCHCVCLTQLNSATATHCTQLSVADDDDDDGGDGSGGGDDGGGGGGGDDDGDGGGGDDGDLHTAELSCKLTEHIMAVETNDTSTFAVTSDRNLVSIQRHGHRYSVHPELSGFKVISVSCGHSHTVVLSAIGVVFSSGHGSQGQLGHGGLESEQSLRVIEALEGVRMIAVSAGGWHSMALSDTDDVYVWGWNDVGQLGLPCHSESLITDTVHDKVDILLFALH